MRSVQARALTLAVAALFAASGCSGSTSSPSSVASSQAPSAAAPSVATPTSAASAAADTTKPPYTVTFPWGTFHLASSIAAKLQAHQPYNLLVEGQADGFPVISKQARDGYQAAVAGASAIYPFNYSYFAPPGNAYNEPLQIQQIQTQVSAGQVDCLDVVPTTSTGLNKLMSQLVDQGIPVFTVGVPTDLSGHDFMNYAQIPLKEGVQAATTVVDWMNKNNKHFTVFAVSSALPAEVWAQGRMISFVQTIKAMVPGATFINDSTNAVNTTLDPTTTYDKAKAFLQGNPSVQVFMNTDIGDFVIDKAIVDLNLKDKVYSVGWNPGLENVTYIQKGVEIATMDQNNAGQSTISENACSTFMATGQILPNTLTLKPVTIDEVPAYLQLLSPPSAAPSK
jgi:ABC-type sugar transport system substrate-binding protein